MEQRYLELLAIKCNEHLDRVLLLLGFDRERKSLYLLFGRGVVPDYSSPINSLPPIAAAATLIYEIDPVPLWCEAENNSQK